MAVLISGCMGGFPDGTGDPSARLHPLSNLDVMTGQLKETGEEVITNTRMENGSPVVLRGDSTPDTWIVFNTFAQTLKAHQYPVFRSADTTTQPNYLVQYHVIGLGVRYGNPFRSGLFGPQYLSRTITTQVSYQVVDSRKGEILTNSQALKTSIDTVAVDDIPGLETASLRSTLGTVPSDSFIDKAVEPFIILGAAGLAIYLLFHIRSS